MTPEQRTRAFTHYTAEAAVALRIEQLEELLRCYMAKYPAFRSKPEGAPGSPVRIEQEWRIQLEDSARRALANVEAARTGANT